MKNTISTILGLIGGGIAYLLGGWTSAMVTLLILMCIDFITGFMVALLFSNSPKTDTGGLKSSVGWKGLARKCCVLFFILIGYRLDLTLGTSYIKDAICIGFIVNELLSIVENAGLMGIPLPNVINNAIELLKNQSNTKGPSN